MGGRHSRAQRTLGGVHRSGGDSPEARVETLWAVRRAVARTLTGEGAQERTLRQLLHSPGADRRDLRPGLRAGEDEEGGGRPGPAPGVEVPAGLLRDGSQASDPPGGGGQHHPTVQDGGLGSSGSRCPVAPGAKNACSCEQQRPDDTGHHRPGISRAFSFPRHPPGAAPRTIPGAETRPPDAPLHGPKIFPLSLKLVVKPDGMVDP